MPGSGDIGGGGSVLLNFNVRDRKGRQKGKWTIDDADSKIGQKISIKFHPKAEFTWNARTKTVTGKIKRGKIVEFRWGY